MKAKYSNTKLKYSNLYVANVLNDVKSQEIEKKSIGFFLHIGNR